MSKKKLDIVPKGRIIKVCKNPLPRTNAPVELPDNPTWIKQSNIITLMSYDFKMIQIKVLVALMDKVQTSMEEAINKVAFEQLTLFTEEVHEGKFLIEISYKDLGVEAYQYNEVRTAVKQLSTIPVELDAIDPLTGSDSWAVTGLFRAYIPKATYTKRFTIEIEKDVAKAFFNVDKGFTRYMKELVFKTKSKYAARMYMLISSWKDKGGFSITTQKFRKWLYLGNKYPNYRDLYKRVIFPAYEELHEKFDCWFEVAEVYNEGEHEPYKLNFKVIRTIDNESESESDIIKIREDCAALLASTLEMKEEHIMKITPLIKCVNDANIIEFKVDDLKEKFSKPNRIKNISEYSKKVIVEALKTSTSSDVF